MLRSIYWYLSFVFSLIFLTPKLLKMKRLEKTLTKEEYLKEVNKNVVNWCMPRIKIAGAKVIIAGAENIPKDEAVLFVSNHQSNFDTAIFITQVKKDKGYIAKIETLKVPLLRDWMKCLNCVFLDRNNMKQAGKAIIEGIKNVKDGYSMVLFPEGKRSKSSNLLEFKNAGIKLAAKSKVKIVPVTIDGTYLLMETNNNKIKPATVYLTIHKPIETKDMTKEDQEELTDKIVATIKSGLKY